MIKTILIVALVGGVGAYGYQSANEASLPSGHDWDQTITRSDGCTVQSHPGEAHGRAINHPYHDPIWECPKDEAAVSR